MSNLNKTALANYGFTLVPDTIDCMEVLATQRRPPAIIRVTPVYRNTLEDAVWEINDERIPKALVPSDCGELARLLNDNRFSEYF